MLRWAARKINVCMRSASERPTEPSAHIRLAEAFVSARRWYPAIAEYRTGITLGGGRSKVLLPLARAYIAVGMVEPAVWACQHFLSSVAGGDDSEARELLAKAQAAAKPRHLINLPPELYSRLKRLADYVSGLYPTDDFSLLDVGGGEGMLSLFLPQARYALAEPGINGISGTNLPFADKSFDVVVSCHVLEHVPFAERTKFLDQLCSKAKSHVLLLNPFADEADGHDEERLKLVIEITGAPWAREHLECGLPGLAEVEQFASARHYGCKITPLNSKATILSYVFLGHYANLARRRNELEKINKFCNTFLFDKLDNEKCPNEYLAEIDVRRREKEDIP